MRYPHRKDRWRGLSIFAPFNIKRKGLKQSLNPYNTFNRSITFLEEDQKDREGLRSYHSESSRYRQSLQ